MLQIMYIGKKVKASKGKYKGQFGRICSYAKTSCCLSVVDVKGQVERTGNIPFKNMEDCQEAVPSVSFVAAHKHKIMTDILTRHEEMGVLRYQHFGTSWKGTWVNFFDNDDGTSNGYESQSERESEYDIEVCEKFQELLELIGEREQMRTLPWSFLACPPSPAASIEEAMTEWWDLYLKDIYYFHTRATKIQTLFRMYFCRKAYSLKAKNKRLGHAGLKILRFLLKN